MTKQGTILIVDDNKGVLAAIDMLLSGTFKKVITISNPNRIPAMLETENIDVVLLDMNFSSGINNGNEGIFWLGEIRKISNDLPVVLFTAYADIELAVKTVKEGATDFVVKPWDNAKLIADPFVCLPLTPIPDRSKTTPGKGSRTKKTTDFGRRVDLGRFSGHATTTSADRESSFYGCQYSDHRRKRYRQGNDCQGTAQTFQTE